MLTRENCCRNNYNFTRFAFLGQHQRLRPLDAHGSPPERPQERFGHFLPKRRRILRFPLRQEPIFDSGHGNSMLRLLGGCRGISFQVDHPLGFYRDTDNCSSSETTSILRTHFTPPRFHHPLTIRTFVEFSNFRAMLLSSGERLLSR